MKRITLTQGKFTVVDDDDFEWLNRWKWFIQPNGGGKFYAARSGPSPKFKIILMHRVICDATRGVQVDHKNGDALDNRRNNLRLCSVSQNQCNRGATRVNTSGFKGVTLNRSKWQARIQVCSRLIYLGCFSTASAAGQAYKIAARKYHGEFSRT